MSTRDETVAEKLEPLDGPGAADFADVDKDLDDEIARTLADELRRSAAPGRGGPHDTVPGAAARPRAALLLEDEAFAQLAAFVEAQRAVLLDRAWDNLAHIDAFARALRFSVSATPFDAPFPPPEPAPNRAPGSSPPTLLSSEPIERASLPPTPAPLLSRMQDDVERRRIAELLIPLLPASARTRAFEPLPAALAERADEGFALRAGDLPRISPLWSAHLADEGLIARALSSGTRVLAPRAACPFAARGTALCLVVEEHKDGMVRGRARLPDGSLVDIRRGPDGAPLRTVDGKEQPIEVPLDAIVALLLGAGPDARGLDLRFSDDRCVLLVYAALLQERALWEPLERPDALTFDERQALVRGCVRAAFDAVARFSLDPLACAISLEKHDGDLDWPERAWALLVGTGAVRDAPARALRPTFARTAVWLDAVLPPGFGAGRVSAVAAGRAFARLVTSVLAPLGVLPCSGFKDGSGSVLLHTLAPPADADSAPALVSIELATFGPVPILEPLEDAWRAGRGTLLPDSRGQPQHDLAAMPSFLGFFLEAADPSWAALGDTPDGASR